MTSIGVVVILKVTVKNGFISLLLLGIVAILLLLGLFIFGPWELPGFGQLSQRQQGQESLAAEGLWPPPGDTDQDGFTDKVEEWIHTDPADNCSDDAKDAAWAPDFNNDKKVDQADVDAFKPSFETKLGNKNYDKRFDLNADKKINLSDVYLVRQYFNKGCPFYFVQTSSTPDSVMLNWVPALPKITYPQLLQIYYGDMTAAQTTECSNTNKALTGSFAGALTNTDVANYLGEGTTSYTWNSATSAYKPIPGHKYCIFFSYGESRDAGASRIVSSFLQVTTPASSPSPSSSPLSKSTLYVYSSGVAGVSIVGTQTGTSGTTNYTVMLDDIKTTLNAPLNSQNSGFSRWEGCDSVSREACTVTVNPGQAKRVIANYASPSPSPF